MRNKIIDKRTALEAALSTVRYQIKHLRKFYSREQVRCWRVRRNSLIAQLKALPTEKQIQAGCKRVNYSNSSKFSRL